jgi:hypothetical protein
MPRSLAKWMTVSRAIPRRMLLSWSFGKQALSADEKQVFSRAFREITGLVEQEGFVESTCDGVLGGRNGIEVLAASHGACRNGVDTEFRHGEMQTSTSLTRAAVPI